MNGVVVVIFNFHFRQRGTAVNTFQCTGSAFVQMTVLMFCPGTDDVGFGFEVRGQVRMRPVAQHARMKSLRAASTCVAAAYSRHLALEFSGGEFLARLTELLLDFQLDRRT